MRLKSIELTGYKTFASKSTFEFAGTITAIVGPNGSGKSNIADALRWVLGEQSYSLLRGKKTVDMIFAGSEHRPRAGMASASVLFDNADGWLPIDFTEVSIARRAYRDGQNEYIINGQRMRLRDITELLGRSGLAERTYTIIGQGLVDRALALKPEDRRKLFEEAAGIGLYRSRREDALRRLEITRRNLDRVKDILAELKPRLRSLQRQSRRAREYEQVKTDLEVLLREWYGYHWHRAQQNLTAAREITRQQEAALGEARAGQAKLSGELNTQRDRIHGLRARLNSWHRELAGHHTRRETLSRDLAVAEERTRALDNQQATHRREIARLEEETAHHRERLQQATAEVERLSAEAAEAKEQTQTARRALQTRQAARTAAERTLQKTRQQLNTLRTRQAQLTARRAELEARAERQQATLAEAGQSLTEAETALQEAETQNETAGQALQTMRNARQQAQQTLQAHRQKRTEAQNQRTQTRETRAARQTEIARLSAQIEVLAQAEKALTGYGAGARTLLQAAQKGRLPGARGALSSVLHVPAEVEPAIAAALGEYLDAVLVETGAQAYTALDLLSGAATRAAILPLAEIAPVTPQPAPADSACVGLAADLVRVEPALRPLVDLLLGRVWVVRSRKAAVRLLAGQPAGLRAVTLAGEVFQPEGPVIAGGTGDGSSTPLSRPRKRRELAEALQTAEGQVKALDAELEQIGARLGQLNTEQKDLEAALREARRREDAAHAVRRKAASAREDARRQHDWQRRQRAALHAEIEKAAEQTRQAAADYARLETEIHQTETTLREHSAQLAALPVDEHQRQLSHWETQAAVATRAATDARSVQRERQQIAAQREQRLTARQGQLAQFAQTLAVLAGKQRTRHTEEAGLNEQIAALQTHITPAEEALQASEAEQERLLAAEDEARQVLTLAERRHAQAQIALAKRQEALETLRGRVEDDFGLVEFQYVDDVAGPTPLPLGAMVEKLPIVREIAPELGPMIKQMRAQLRRMGAINPEAQKEYEDVQERHEFMTGQIADLEQAEADIKEVIAELDVLMEREFRKTFDAVAGEFRQIFTRLFGGGSGRLLLTQPDDLTNSGVDIEARLPGRRTQGLSLLSGGERSLTAAALVFSLLKVSPTPFCVLDEVDAMLDEANVGRFVDLLRELSQKTQFVIITHNRNTVQAADIIYGITMGRDSTSQVLSLRLDEVTEALKQ